MRSKKLNDLLRDVVAGVIEGELDVVGSPLVTVLAADVSPTLEHATIKISVLPVDREADVLRELKHIVYDLQQSVNAKLRMRPVPKIRFVIDETEERAARIEKLLEDK